jgi:apolipoprotein N-acyltransferase
MGSDDIEPAPDAHSADEVIYYNSSFLMSPQGELKARYNKRQLVIFGEYIPLIRWLPFLKWFTPIQGGFTPGKSAVPFRLGQLDVNLSVLICFEDTFADTARTSTDEDTDILLNLTNDAWFQESAAQWQHNANATFRTVENRVPLVRCCNNGLTCWVDKYGRVRDILSNEQTGVYGAGFKIMEIPVAPRKTGVRTPYNHHGDRWAWACLAWSLARILPGLRWSRKNK